MILDIFKSQLKKIMSVILAQLSKRTKLIDIFKRAKLLKINILQAAACRLNSVALLTYLLTYLCRKEIRIYNNV
jgi:hypothetical protein